MPMGKLYVVYDKQAGDCRIGSYTSEAAEKLLGVSKYKVSVYADQHTRYQGRYLFVKEEDEIMELKWDAARYKILAEGRKKCGNKNYKETPARLYEDKKRNSNP
nr:MAG TPA: hypothetical protein [Caudoviricetes sp.]